MKFIVIIAATIYIPFLSGCAGTSLPPGTTATGNVDYSKDGVPSGNLSITLAPVK